MDRDIEDTRQPVEGVECPICDGRLEETATGWVCIDPDCGWGYDFQNCDADDEE